jgi:hypothetical protein
MSQVGQSQRTYSEYCARVLEDGNKGGPANDNRILTG